MLTFGNLKMPYLDSSEAPDIGGQALAQAQRLELISGAGVALVADTAELADLVTDGDAFDGLIALQNDSDQVWLRRAGSTIPLPVNVRRQMDTTNDTVAMTVQAGIGRIAGAASASVTEAVTFGTAFKAATFPVVVVGFVGQIAPATTFDPPSAIQTGSAVASAGAVTPTGFTAMIAGNLVNLTTGRDLFYSWIAVGEPA